MYFRLVKCKNYASSSSFYANFGENSQNFGKNFRRFFVTQQKPQQKIRPKNETVENPSPSENSRAPTTNKPQLERRTLGFKGWLMERVFRMQQRQALKDAKDEALLSKVFHRFYEMDKCDAKSWELIYIERMRGLITFFALSIYGALFVLVSFSANVYWNQPTPRPTLLQIMLAFDQWSLFDKSMFWFLVLSTLIYTNARRKFIYRLYKHREEKGHYRLITKRWDLWRSEALDFHTKDVELFGTKFLWKYLIGNVAVKNRWLILHQEGFNYQEDYFRFVNQCSRK